MVDKLTVDQSIGAAVVPSRAGVPANARIRQTSGPSVRLGAGGKHPQVSLSGTLAPGKIAGIQEKPLKARQAPPGGVDSDAGHSSSAHQFLNRFIRRVIPDNSQPSHGGIPDKSRPSPEEARKVATALIGHCNWDDALSLMNLLRAKDITPNVINYGALMGRAKCEFDRERASIKVLKIYEDMRKDKVHPNLLVCTTVITALGRQGRADDAEKVFREMEKRGDRADFKAFGALMSAYATKADDRAATAGQRLEAANAMKDLYKEFIERGHGADEHKLGPSILTLVKGAREWPPVRSML